MRRGKSDDLGDLCVDAVGDTKDRKRELRRIPLPPYEH